MKPKAQGIVVAFAAAALSLAGVNHAYAQAGIGVVQTPTRIGTIGHNKGQPNAGPVLCPAGTVMTGIYHRDKGEGAAGSTVGMTADFGLYCSSVSTNGSSVILTQTTAAGTPEITAGAYRFALPPVSSYCATGRIGLRFGGWDRDWDEPGGYPAWASAFYMDCATLAFTPADGWMRLTTTPSSLERIEAGVREVRAGSAAHQIRGPWCGDTATSLVTGLYAERGGEGHDGINVYCGNLVQARHSAIMTFSDFAWDKSLSATGWRVNLNLGSTLLSNAAGMSGANKIPYANASANTVAYNSASEVYVVPNSNYQATVSGRPTAFSGAGFNDAYVTTGSCTTGQTLADLQDASCTLNVEGLADLTPTVTSPPNVYNAYGQQQPVTVTVTNVGPGATVAGDGFRMTATLPAGWTASNLPAGCTLTGQTVTCTLPALAASAAPATSGGQFSMTFNVSPVSPTANGTFTLPVTVDASTPNGDANPGNNDYNLSNNSTNGTLQLLLNAQINLSKVWSGALVNDAALLTATPSSGSAVTFNAVATSASQTQTGTAAPAPIGSVYTLNEVMVGSNVGQYTPGAWSCIGGTLAGNQLTIRPQDSGNAVVCSITNTRRSADVRVTKVSNAPSVRSGENVIWTITATNNGPDAANNTVLKDTPGAGMDCTVVPPTCSGTSCPAGGITAAGLASGITIPNFPSGAQIVVTLTCRVTASGL